MLGKNATKIFTGTDGMEKFFPADKIMVTGNPVRKTISQSTITRSEGIKFFSLDENKKTILVVGGSLGARSINEAIDKRINELLKEDIQLIWQTGKLFTPKSAASKLVWVNAFINQMEYAYAAADIIVSRSGAMSVAEICVVKKPVLFVPYPFAAEDHQTVNAMQLVNKNAAMMVKDNEVKEKLMFMTIELAKDESKQNELRTNIATLAITDADVKIAKEILKTL
jgi:UDP-N-acetylglucosamine--N-acetylmuramyl-(pentapeptide) pyrophosphoryl-undecaprenol N-acetylglucosamine transferase